MAHALTERTSPLARTQALLRAHDARSMAGSLGKFVTGVLWCLGAACLFATLVVIIFWALGVGSLIGWIGWFGVYWLVILPLLILQERKSQPGYLIESLSSHIDPNPSSGGEFLANRGRVGVAILGNMFMWGPRALLEGFSSIRGRPTAKRIALFKRAATMVLELAKYDGGVEIRGLMPPPEDMPVFTQAIDWLDKHDYIGKSSDGERLWITTIGKKRLSDHGIELRMKVQVVK